MSISNCNLNVNELKTLKASGSITSWPSGNAVPLAAKTNGGRMARCRRPQCQLKGNAASIIS